MTDIKLVDVTVHIDENLPSEGRSKVEDALRALDGVVSVGMPEDKPHLLIVEYDPDKQSSGDILKCVTGQNVHAELIGI